LNNERAKLKPDKYNISDVKKLIAEAHFNIANTKSIYGEYDDVHYAEAI
jgi:hypothetical protein